MTKPDAEATADLILAVVGAAAALVVITTPPLRRLVSRAARIWLGASVPAYLLAEAHSAWVESGRRPRHN
jgi:hypothetical protein